MKLNKFQQYINYILSLVCSLIITILVCDTFNISTTLGRLIILIVNWVIIYYLGAYIITKIDK